MVFPGEGRGPVPRSKPNPSLSPGNRKESGRMNKAGYVYIMASQQNGTLSIGATSNLVQRVYQHRNGLIDGFTKKYNCKFLVWYQAFDDLEEARHRELQMKEWQRVWKLRAIEAVNPQWNDLYLSLM